MSLILSLLPPLPPLLLETELAAIAWMVADNSAEADEFAIILAKRALECKIKSFMMATVINHANQDMTSYTFKVSMARKNMDLKRT
jgi:hypothetical protein